ncbi:hypothetical protein FGO68_gene3377 [Halteria grandinella]|uniref:Uncharacterized protein n=1 Tax=Halteria grandinella TaxID=5974 RepID=A0A8J8P2D0_HALGN|nr:hypothetical protein FGO68_gene3377 [Halteria grandinella]
MELLRKVQSGLKGKKYVSFKVDANMKKQPTQGKGNPKQGAQGSASIAPQEVLNNDGFPYDMYITKLVEVMNEDHIPDPNDSPDWKSYKKGASVKLDPIKTEEEQADEVNPFEEYKSVLKQGSTKNLDSTVTVSLPPIAPVQTVSQNNQVIAQS